MSIKPLLFAALLLAATGCGYPVVNKQAASDKIAVVTTFSTLNSFVQAVGGAHVRVQNLVPVGVSPENYQPTPQDIALLSDAKVLIENGAGMEAWLQHTIDNVKNPNLRIAVMTNGLRLNGKNPHLWMDPVLAKSYVAAVRVAFTSADPAHRADYARNAATYDRQLDALRADIAKQIATIPKARRTMIVFHNAWQYYNDRFGLRTVGVIELSPGQDPNPQYLGRLIDLAKANNVRAVFAEPEYSPKLVNALAASARIKTVENLYDDSIGQDARVRDYASMLRYDTDVIVRALK